MDGVRWFEETGTIAFDPLYMRNLIFFGDWVFDPETCTASRQPNPSKLCLAQWLSMVPDIYRAWATEQTLLILKGPRFLGEKANDQIIQRFVYEFQGKVYCSVQDAARRACRFEEVIK